MKKEKFKLPRKKKKLFAKWVKGWSFTPSPTATNLDGIERDVWEWVRNARYNQGVTEIFKSE